MAVAAVGYDLALRSGGATVAGASLLVVLAVGLVVASRTRNGSAWLLAAPSVLVACWLPLRTSPWLVPIDLLVAFGLIMGAASYGRSGHLLDLTFADAARRGSRTVGQFVMAPIALAGSVADGWRRRRSVPEGRAPEVGPEAVVVRHNVARDDREVPFDAAYAPHLSDDAVPALVAALPDLDPAAAAQTQATLCESVHPDQLGFWNWNRATARADAARATLPC